MKKKLSSHSYLEHSTIQINFILVCLAIIKKRHEMSGNQNNDSIETLRDSLKHFGVADYSVFIAMLLSCTVVGLYFGYEDYMKRKSAKKHRRGSEAQDYLMGGRNMKIFPVAMSLVASCISGIALLGKSFFFIILKCLTIF